MRDFFRSVRFKILVGVALVLLGLMIRTATDGGTASVTANAVAAVTSPVQRVSAMISRFFYGIADNIISIRTAKQENVKLKKQLSELQAKMVDYDRLKGENELLQKAQGLTAENPGFKLKPATLISRSGGQWFSSFEIDAGSRDGVSYHDAVITQDNGLVGLVTQVMYSSAVVTTVLDPSIAEGVVASETGDIGTAKGDLTLMNSGKLRAVNFDPNSAVAAGDILVTAGRSGTYPGSLRVGTVESVKAEDTGASLSAVIKPVVDVSHLSDVYVVTDFSGKQQLAAQSGGK